MRNQNRFAQVLRGVLAASATLLVAVVVNGCVAGSEPSPADSVDDGSTKHELAGNCCYDGYWFCAKLKNGTGADEFDYVNEGCGAPTSTTAHTNCTAACAVTCTNSGLINEC